LGVSFIFKIFSSGEWIVNHLLLLSFSTNVMGTAEICSGRMAGLKDHAQELEPPGTQGNL